MKKGRSQIFIGSALANYIPATTYSPTESPLQYHRPWRA
jgi:hypothetical protein